MASHLAFAMVFASESLLALSTAEVNNFSHTVPALQPACARSTWQPVCRFPGMPVCSWTLWKSASTRIRQRVLALLFIHLAGGCTGPGSMHSVHQKATWESLMAATFVSPYVNRVSLCLSDTWNSSPVIYSWDSLSSTPLVLR